MSGIRQRVSKRKSPSIKGALDADIDEAREDAGTADHAFKNARPDTISYSRRRLALGGLTALSSALSACGGGSGGDAADAGAQPNASGLNAMMAGGPGITDAAAAHFLLHAHFTATTNEIAAVKSAGYEGWLNNQFRVGISQTAWNWMDSRGYNLIDSRLNFFDLGFVDHAMWAQLLTSGDTVRKRAAFALSQFFVVSANPFDGHWPAYMLAAWWDLLNTHAFGNFRQLLEAVTLSPAMGRYLNMKGNAREDKNGRVPDENYAREVMQLFTIGLNQLNSDGSVKTDAWGKPLSTYAQNDVTSLAHVMTGYDWDTSSTVWTSYAIGNSKYNVPTREFCSKPMRFNAANHSTKNITFLGKDIAGNLAGPAKLKIVLDLLFNHPNVGPFFGRQMIQRLVTSNPSPDYVRRVSDAFNNNGAGVRGDLKAVWRAILTDPEAQNIATASTGGKLREPVLRFVQLCRTLGATSSNGKYEIHDMSNGGFALNQSPLRAASVFNFYRPGYVPPGSGMAAVGVTAPEFQIVTESSVAGYLNLIMSFLKNGVKDITVDLTFLTHYATNTQSLLDWLNLRLAAGQLSAGTLTTIKAALDKYPKADTPAQRMNIVQSAIFLVMASPDYLIQR